MPERLSANAPARYHDIVASRAAAPFQAQPQTVWGLEIAGYLYLGGLGAGAFAVAVMLDWLSFGVVRQRGAFFWGIEWEWTKLLWLWGPVFTAVGASLLILHLGRNRWLFYTAGANPRTSWMARGFSILLAFILSAGAVAIVAVFAPDWRQAHIAPWRAVEAGAVLAALGTAAYTGVLLRSMSFIPAWGPASLPALFMVSALSTGSMGNFMAAWFLEAAAGMERTSDHLHALLMVEPLLIVLEGAVLAVYLATMGRGNSAAVTSASMLLRGRWRFGFWGGVVGAALALPLCLDLIDLATGSHSLAVIAAISVLLGGFVLRLAVLGVGVKEMPPLYCLGQWRDAHPPATQSLRSQSRGWVVRCTGE